MFDIQSRTTPEGNQRHGQLNNIRYVSGVLVGPLASKLGTYELIGDLGVG